MRVFFEEYPNIKSYVEKLDFYDFKIIKHDDTNYYRVFEQIIGDKKFIRVVRGVKPLTDDYIKQWRNPDRMSSHEQHTYFVHLFYLPENEDPVAILPISRMEADGYAWENGTNNKYEMIEIIQRNGNVKGFMQVRLEDRIDHHNRAEESREPTEKYINTAEYYLFDDVINGATEKIGKIRYIKNYDNLQFVSIEASQPLIDLEKPFMYTVNNTFDGNPKTAFVENTIKDSVGFEFVFNSLININKIQIINGYAASKDLYFKNNQLKTIEISGLYEDFDVLLDNSLQQTIVFQELSFKKILNTDYIYIYSYESLYRGTKYSDSCVAELDITVNDNWLFGE